MPHFKLSFFKYYFSFSVLLAHQRLEGFDSFSRYVAEQAGAIQWIQEKQVERSELTIDELCVLYLDAVQENDETRSKPYFWYGARALQSLPQQCAKSFSRVRCSAPEQAGAVQCA